MRKISITAMRKRKWCRTPNAMNAHETVNVWCQIFMKYWQNAKVYVLIAFIEIFQFDIATLSRQTINFLNSSSTKQSILKSAPFKSFSWIIIISRTEWWKNETRNIRDHKDETTKANTKPILGIENSALWIFCTG